LFLTPDNNHLLLAIQNHGVWKANLIDLVQTIGIDSVSAPPEAEPGETVSVEINLSHSFAYDSSIGAKKKIYVGLYEQKQGDWVAGVSDEVGIEPHQNIDEESLTYTIGFTTPPQEGDYELEARVYYQRNDEWYYNKHEYLQPFKIKVETVSGPGPEPEPEPESKPEPDKPRGIPGFTIESIVLGMLLVIVFFMRLNQADVPR